MLYGVNKVIRPAGFDGAATDLPVTNVASNLDLEEAQDTAMLYAKHYVYKHYRHYAPCRLEANNLGVTVFNDQLLVAMFMVIEQKA